MSRPSPFRLPTAADAADPVTGESLVAARQAGAAATAAGVRVEPVAEPRRLRVVADLFAQVWGTPPGHDPFAPDVLRSIAHAGGAVHVAFKGSRPVGAAGAIFGPPRSGTVYSLIAASRSSDRGVGLAVKQEQRAWALAHGARSMVWTFDPLVSRNARFNLVKLGAVAPTYLVDFYGPLDDGVNAGDETDRLSVVWSLTGDRANDAAEGRHPEVEGPDLDTASVDSRLAPDGGPLVARDADTLWCRVPADVVAVRHAHPERAAQWRTAVREIFLSAIGDGYVATGMTRDGWYRLTREEAS